MNNRVSTNFLLLKDIEQVNIINYLSKDLRRRELYLHFAYLYNLKKKFVKDQQNKPVQNNPTNKNNQMYRNHFERINEKPKMFEKPKIPEKQREFIPIKPKIPEKTKEVSFSDKPKEIISEKPKSISVDVIKENLKELKNLKKTFQDKNDNQLVPKQIPNFSQYIQKFLVQEKLKKLVENKNVAIIGPASYLTNMNQGNTIDQYDVVIRFNKGVLSNPDFYHNVGQKTDIWIYNFKDISLLDKISITPKLIFCPYPKEIIDNYLINKPLPNCPIEFIEPHFYKQLQIAMNFEPNSALLSILVLLRQNVKSLYVSGISFMYDGYYDNPEKNDNLKTGELIINKSERNNFMSIMKKLYNANDKLLIDNTMINLIYPNFIQILNNLFHKQNHSKLFSTLNYSLFVPSFQSKYNDPNNNSKIYVHFGEEPISSDLIEKMNLVVHCIKPKLSENEVFIKHTECNYDDLEALLSVKNKGIVYFSNNSWTAIDNMLPKKNRDYILRHHCYVNGNIYGLFIKNIVQDFDINEDNKNINMLYMLFSLIYYGQKIIYLSKENVAKNGLKEIINVMNKLNLIKYIN